MDTPQTPNGPPPGHVPPPAPTVGTFLRIDIAGQVTDDAQALAIKQAVSQALVSFPGIRLQMSLMER